MESGEFAYSALYSFLLTPWPTELFIYDATMEYMKGNK